MTLVQGALLVMALVTVGLALLLTAVALDVMEERRVRIVVEKREAEARARLTLRMLYGRRL